MVQGRLILSCFLNTAAMKISSNEVWLNRYNLSQRAVGEKPGSGKSSRSCNCTGIIKNIKFYDAIMSAQQLSISMSLFVVV